MRINWFKDENHLVYINGATQLADLERTLHFPGLEEAANELRQHPTAEGFTIKGPKRTSGRLFVPDLTFGEHIEMGENIFFYMGEMRSATSSTGRTHRWQSEAASHMTFLQKHPGQMSDSMLTAFFIILSGGLQDAYTYCCRGRCLPTPRLAISCC